MNWCAGRDLCPLERATLGIQWICLTGHIIQYETLDKATLCLTIASLTDQGVLAKVTLWFSLCYLLFLNSTPYIPSNGTSKAILSMTTVPCCLQM